MSSNNLDKYEYLTGEGLGYIQIVIEKAKFEYSPLGKIFTKGLDKDEDKKEGLLKRLKNIEGKIKGENKKESEPIKNEEQSEVLKDQSTMADKKLKEIALLKDKLDYIFKNFGSNFNSIGKNVLKKLAKDEKNIDYNNLFFEIYDKFVAKDVAFLEEFGTLYDLLIYLLGDAERVLTFTEAQIYFFKAMHVLEIIISSIKNDITNQSEGQKKEIFAEQESVLNNA